MVDHSLRKEVLTAAYESGTCWLPSTFSCVEILCAIFETAEPDDAVILSKAHASLALYACLNKYRGADLDLHTYAKAGSMLGGHADRLQVPGVDVTCGSLGIGLAMAVGMAMSGRKTYCVCGDRELQEGVAQEALAITDYENLTVIVGCNDCGFDHEPDVLGEVGWEYGDVNHIGTQSGFPCPTLMEAPNFWHRRCPNAEEYKQLMHELDEAEASAS